MTFVPILEYEDYYEINQNGDVYRLQHLSTDRWGNLIIVPRYKMKWIKHGTGYLTIRLTKNKVAKTYRLHILVAKAFLPNLNQLPEVNHKDGNKHNPSVDNLEWCTRLFNAKHAAKNGLYSSGFRNGGSKLSFEDIQCAKRLALTGVLFQDIAPQFKVTPTTISRAVDRVFGKSWRDSLPDLKVRAGRLGREKQIGMKEHRT